MEGDGKNMIFLPSILDALAYTLANDKPDILLLTGDLTFNGEKESHQELARRLARIEKLGIKVYVIPGNHDIENPYARSFSGDTAYRTNQVQAVDFARIYRRFGYAEAISRDPDTLSYMVEPFPGLRLLMLDSNVYHLNSLLGISVSDGEIRQSTRQWIREQAQAAEKAGCRIVATMHHSLTEHNAVVSRGFTVEDSQGVAELLASLDIRLILTGHIHVQSITQAVTSAGPVWDIATSAFSVFPHEYGLLEFVPQADLPPGQNGEGAWSYRLLPVQVKAWAQTVSDAPGFDERLNNFDVYAEEFFKLSSARMITRRLTDLEEPLTEEETSQVIDLVGTLNARFFAGRSGENSPELLASPGFTILTQRMPGFLDHYVRSISGSAKTQSDREVLVPAGR
jgi:3',5'-cyclic AMP phosphodiesterase CpdA